MTAAVHRSATPSLTIPHTQNTATVLEFNCLYTHDIRRKQKRWQDGFLRFHTFNKRVMVYDLPRNFIGDAHWRPGEQLQDGDEVTLEKGGVIVQVAESIGRTETDLTELKKSKKKGSSEQGSSSPLARPTAQTPAASRRLESTISKPTTQLKHRSLNALLGTPKGVLGKAALPTKSPFEQRRADVENLEWEEGRAPKRQRVEQPGWNVTRTTTVEKPGPKKQNPLWARTIDAGSARRKQESRAGGQQKLGTKEIIDLSNESDERTKFLNGFSSDALIPPSSPERHMQPVTTIVTVRSSSPAFQTQHPPTRTAERNISDAVGISNTPLPIDTTLQPPPPRRPPAQLSENGWIPPNNHEKPIENANVHPKIVDVEQNARAPSGSKRADVNPGQTLRLAAGAPKKKTLLCQQQISKKPLRTHSANTESAIDALLDVTSQSASSRTVEPNATVNEPRSQRRQLQERLARINRKTGDTAEDLQDAEDHDVSECHVNEYNSKSVAARPQTPLNTNALELAQLDQMIMPAERRPSPAIVPEAEPEQEPEPVQQERPLRRVVSESNNPTSSRPKRVPGAPVRYTPSPAKKSPTPAVQLTSNGRINPETRPKTAAPPRTRMKKPIQRAVSLNTTSNGTATVILSKPFQAPKPPDVRAVQPEQAANPWSREAFDLFTWRPPGWDEEGWCLNIGD